MRDWLRALQKMSCILLVGLLFCSWNSVKNYSLTTAYASTEREWDNLFELPPLPEGTELSDHAKNFAYRGRIGFFMLPPSVMGCYFDNEVNYSPPEDAHSGDQKPAEHKTAEQYFLENEIEIKDKELWHHDESIKIMYRRKVVGRSFAGAYIMILADLSEYGTMTFMIKGENGGERFTIGMNDAISNEREDMVAIGSINRFLPGGVTRDWQIVKINMSEFFGPDLTKVMSLVFDINEESSGTIWIDDLRFYKNVLYNPLSDVYKKGYMVLDNFDFSYLNLLGRKTNTYKKLPSVCHHTLDEKVYYGDSGKSLRIDYDKQGTGWAGYYSLLNQIDGEWFDLSEFDRVSFMIKGAKGGEDFEIGMADKNWVIIGDSLKGGSVTNYLPDGVTTEWQEVVIPLADFGLLDLTEMGSFVINFNKKQSGTVWIDDLKFYLKQEEEEEPDW